MADVEKLNINNTDYDIADAKALRNKDNVGSGTFVDSRAGTTTYPTPGTNLVNSTIIGDKAYVNNNNNISGITVVGANAYAGSSNVTVVGNNSYALAGYSLVGGYQALANASASSSVVLGSFASSYNTFNTVAGYGASANASNNVVVGANALANAGATYATICGRASSVGSYCSYSAVLGASASVTQSYSVQLGSGTNSSYGSLQFRNWLLVDNGGKIPEERLPSTVRFTTDEPTVLEWQDDDQLRKLVFMYTGVDNDLFKHGLCYQAKAKQGHPKFYCGYTSTDYIPRNECVQVDNEKLFLKLAEISKARYEDEGNWENSLIGGDNAEQSFYFYYNVNDAQWRIEISNDSFERGFTGTPDTYYFKQGETLEDFGIYVKDLTLPTDADADEEVFDLSYYAPAYCDNYNFGSDISSVNYIKLMNAMCDEDWGFGYAIPNMESWHYEVDGTSYEMPIIPETYISKQDGNEYDGVTVRWEWDNSGDGIWKYYINGKNTGYKYTTAQLEQNFGIVLDASEGETEHIEFYFRGAKQLYWQQFNPIEDTEYAKQEDLDALETQVQPLLDWKVNTQTRNMYNLNNYTTPGWYYFPNASNVTNRPSTVGIGFMLLVQKNINNVISQHLFACVGTNIVGGTNYGYETSMVYSRVFAFNYWYAWQSYLTNGTMCNVITGYDKTKKQYLVHDADTNKLKWEDAQ